MFCGNISNSQGYLEDHFHFSYKMISHIPVSNDETWDLRIKKNTYTSHCQISDKELETYWTNSACGIVDRQSTNIQHPHNIQDISFLGTDGLVGSIINIQSSFLLHSHNLNLQRGGGIININLEHKHKTQNFPGISEGKQYP